MVCLQDVLHDKHSSFTAFLVSYLTTGTLSAEQSLICLVSDGGAITIKVT